jgi:hypothetical protein
MLCLPQKTVQKLQSLSSNQKENLIKQFSLMLDDSNQLQTVSISKENFKSSIYFFDINLIIY